MDVLSPSIDRRWPLGLASFVALAVGTQLLADPLSVPAQVIARSDQLRGDQPGPMPLEHRTATDPQLGGKLSRRYQRHDQHRKRMFCALASTVRTVCRIRRCTRSVAVSTPNKHPRSR